MRPARLRSVIIKGLAMNGFDVSGGSFPVDLVSHAIDLNISPSEIVESVLGSAFDLNDWWHVVEYVDTCDWDRFPVGAAGIDYDAPFLRLAIDNPEGGPRVRRFVSMADILGGLVAWWLSREAAAAAVDGLAAVNKWRRSVLSDGELDLDSDSGDCIMQYVVLGDVVYG